jgi:glutathione S-transferase
VTPTLHLYGLRAAPFTEKVVRALRLKRLPFELHEPETAEDYRRWNPETGLLPLLDLGGERVHDSTAILLRLDERFPDPPLLASDPRTAAAQRRLEEWADVSFFWYWLRWQGTQPQSSAIPVQRALADARPGVDPPAAGLTHALRSLGARLRRRFAQQSPARPSDAARIRDELDQRLQDLVRLLARRPFFYSERVSMADLAVFAMLRSLAGDSIPGGANLLARRAELLAFMRRVEDASGGP